VYRVWNLTIFDILVNLVNVCCHKEANRKGCKILWCVAHLHFVCCTVCAKLGFLLHDLRNLLLARCFSLCIETVQVIVCCSFCNLQFLESVLWVPGRWGEYYEWNTREANQVCGCVLACSLYCVCVCVFVHCSVCADQGSDRPQSQSGLWLCFVQQQFVLCVCVCISTLQHMQIKAVTTHKYSCLWCCTFRCCPLLYMFRRGVHVLYMQHVRCVHHCLQPVDTYRVAYETSP
jgi:hypothetical protein